MIAYIDTHRDQFGVELICRVLRALFRDFSPPAVIGPRARGHRRTVRSAMSS